MTARTTSGPIRPAWSSQLDRVRALLRSRRNVIGVGFGFGSRDRAGPSDRPAWLVYVSRKVPAHQLAPDELVPEWLFGLRTHVVVAHRGQPVAGSTIYAPSAEITNTANDGGTLGCFATKGNDLLLLTASHVLFASNADQTNPNLDIYSPNYSSCCGGGQKIAVSQGSWSDGWRAAGSAYDTDCAIAGLVGNIQYSNQIPQIGMITGTGPDPGPGMVLPDFTTMPTDQQLVRMYSGLKQGGGLRYGTIVRLLSGSASSPLSAGPFQDASDTAQDSRPTVNQLVIMPRLPPVANETQAAYAARYNQFATSGGVLTFSLKGDSGSVIVDNQSGSVNVIGMLIREYRGSDVRANLISQGQPIPDALQVVQNFGIVTPISNVLAQMQITIPGNVAGTAPAAGSSQLIASPAFASVFDRKSIDAAIEGLWARLLEERHGALITAKFDEHHAEVRRLVNTVRRVSATWIRCQGPAFMRHCVVSLRDPTHRIPNVINGASFTDLLGQMQLLLLRYGCDRLRRDIRRLGPFAIHLLTSVGSVHEVPAALSARERRQGSAA
jgi:hypothetical protein